MPTRKEGRRRRLGRGLGSLISAPTEVEAPAAARTGILQARSVEAKPAPAAEGDHATSQPTLAIDVIHRNPGQPRKDFDEKALDALAASIRSEGVMQPIVVRRSAAGGYELVAGERRWRAARRAGLEEIPAIIREADDRKAAELSLIENLQREDLNAMERADAFRKLIEGYGLKHQEVGEIVGMDRSTITNHLRLLELSEPEQEVVRMGFIGVGHGRALLAVKDSKARSKLTLKAAREGWSVRVTEREVSRFMAAAGVTAGRTPSDAAPPAVPAGPRQAQRAYVERRLGEQLGTRVQIRPGKKKGSGLLVISFFDGAQFEGLVERLGVKLEEF